MLPPPPDYQDDLAITSAWKVSKSQALPHPSIGHGGAETVPQVPPYAGLRIPPNPVRYYLLSSWCSQHVDRSCMLWTLPELCCYPAAQAFQAALLWPHHRASPSGTHHAQTLPPDGKALSIRLGQQLLDRCTLRAARQLPGVTHGLGLNTARLLRQPATGQIPESRAAVCVTGSSASCREDAGCQLLTEGSTLTQT